MSREVRWWSGLSVERGGKLLVGANEDKNLDVGMLSLQRYREGELAQQTQKAGEGSHDGSMLRLSSRQSCTPKIISARVAGVCAGTDSADAGFAEVHEQWLQLVLVVGA